MAMVNVVYWQPTRGLGPKVGSHLALCCIHHMNQVTSHNPLSMMTAP